MSALVLFYFNIVQVLTVICHPFTQNCFKKTRTFSFIWLQKRLPSGLLTTYTRVNKAIGPDNQIRQKTFTYVFHINVHLISITIG